MSEAALTCANHPDRETSLRCNRCEKPICAQCAVLTPVGYRCKECVRGQQAVFDTARPYDYPMAVVIAAVGVALSIGVLRLIGFWGFFVAPVAGGAIAELVRWAVRRRRSRRLPLVTALGGAAGLLPYVAMPLLGLLLSLAGGFDLRLLGGALVSLLWPSAYGALIISSLYYRLRGIRVA